VRVHDEHQLRLWVVPRRELRYADLGSVRTCRARGGEEFVERGRRLRDQVGHREGPWNGRDQVEAATLEWVHWFNTERTPGSIDDLTPIEAEAFYYSHRKRQAEAA
jgi:transposase InsO family protein